MGLRKLVVGPISGMSSYELAIKYGSFTGTEAEYAQKEQKVFDDMVEYANNIKQEIQETLIGYDIHHNGSWFLKNGISSLNGVIDNIRTIMGNEVISGKPDKLDPSSMLTFECNTVNDENGIPVLSRQIIVEMTPGNNINIYHRGQIISDGEVVIDGWSDWERLGEATEGTIRLYSKGTPQHGYLIDGKIHLDNNQET